MCSPESVLDVLERTSPGGSGCCRLELPAFTRCRIGLLSQSREGISNLLLPLRSVRLEILQRVPETSSVACGGAFAGNRP